MAEYRATYKCRLCGELFCAPTYTTDEQTAMSCAVCMVTGIRGINAMQPSPTHAHACGGKYAGSLGLADFQGWKKEE